MSCSASRPATSAEVASALTGALLTVSKAASRSPALPEAAPQRRKSGARGGVPVPVLRVLMSGPRSSATRVERKDLAGQAVGGQRLARADALGQQRGQALGLPDVVAQAAVDQPA